MRCSTRSCVLRAHARHRAQVPLRHLPGVPRHPRPDRRSSTPHPEGLLPDARTPASSSRITDRGAGRELRGDEPAAAPGERRSSRKDPAVPGVTSSVGAGAAGRPPITAASTSRLKPWGERDTDARGVIARLSQKIAVDRTASAVHAARAGRLGSAAGCRAREYQYTLSDPDASRAEPVGAQAARQAEGLPQLADVTSDQAGAGLTATLTYDKDAAARYGIQPGVIDATLNDAFGQRQVAQYFTDLKAYYVILEVTPSQQGTLDTLRQLYVRSAAGQPVPLSTFVQIDTRARAAAGREPPEPVPRRHHLLQPQARLPRWATASPPSTRPRQRWACRRRCRASSRAPRRPSSPRSAASRP